MDKSWTIDTVIGYGKSFRIIFPTTLLIELDVYQTKQRHIIFEESLYVDTPAILTAGLHTVVAVWVS